MSYSADYPYQHNGGSPSAPSTPGAQIVLANENDFFWSPVAALQPTPRRPGRPSEDSSIMNNPSIQSERFLRAPPTPSDLHSPAVQRRIVELQRDIERVKDAELDLAQKESALVRARIDQLAADLAAANNDRASLEKAVQDLNVALNDAEHANVDLYRRLQQLNKIDATQDDLDYQFHIELEAREKIYQEALERAEKRAQEELQRREAMETELARMEQEYYRAEEALQRRDAEAQRQEAELRKEQRERMRVEEEVERLRAVEQRDRAQEQRQRARMEEEEFERERERTRTQSYRERMVQEREAQLEKEWDEAQATLDARARELRAQKRAFEDAVRQSMMAAPTAAIAATAATLPSAVTDTLASSTSSSLPSTSTPASTTTSIAGSGVARTSPDKPLPLPPIFDTGSLGSPRDLDAARAEQEDTVATIRSQAELIEQIVARNHGLEQQLQVLRQQVEGAEEQLDESANTCQQYISDLQRLNTMNDQLNVTVQTLQEQLHVLESKLAVSDSENASSRAEMEQYQRQLESLQAETMRLQGLLAVMGDVEGEGNRNRSLLLQMEQTAATQKTRIEELTRELTLSRQENDRLSENQAQQARSLNELRIDSENKDAVIKTMREEKETLARRVEELEKTILSLTTTHEKSLLSLSSQHHESLQTLSKQLDGKHGDLVAQYAKVSEECATLHTQCTTLREENVKLRTAQTLAERESSELRETLTVRSREHTENIQQLERQCAASLQEQREVLMASWEMERNDLKAQSAKMQVVLTERAEAVKKCDTLQEQVRGLTQDMHRVTGELEAAKLQNVQVSASMSTLREESARAAQEAAKAKAEAQVARDERDAVKLRVMGLEEQVNTAQDTLLQLPVLRKRLKETQEQLLNTQSELSVANAKISDLKRQQAEEEDGSSNVSGKHLQVLENQWRELHNKLKLELSTVLNENKRLQELCHQYLQQYEQIVVRNKEVEKESHVVREEVVKLTQKHNAEYNAILLANNKLENEKGRLEYELSKAQDMCQYKDERIVVVSDDLKLLADKYHKLEQAINTHRDDADSASLQLRRAQIEAEDATNKLQKTQKEVQELEDKLFQCRESEELLKRKVVDGEKAQGDLQHRNSELTGSLQEAKHSITALEQRVNVLELQCKAEKELYEATQQRHAHTLAQMEDEHAQQMQARRQKCEDDVAHAQKHASKVVDDMKALHANVIAEMTHDHEQQKTRLVAAHEEQVKALRENFEAQLSSLANEHTQEREHLRRDLDEQRNSYEAALATLREEHQLRLAQVQDEVHDELQSIREDYRVLFENHDAEWMERMEDVKRDYEAQLTQLRSEHTEAVRAVEADCAAQVAALQREVGEWEHKYGEHVKKMSALEQDLRRREGDVNKLTQVNSTLQGKYQEQVASMVALRQRYEQELKEERERYDQVSATTQVLRQRVSELELGTETVRAELRAKMEESAALWEREKKVLQERCESLMQQIEHILKAQSVAEDTCLCKEPCSCAVVVTEQQVMQEDGMKLSFLSSTVQHCENDRCPSKQSRFAISLESALARVQDIAKRHTEMLISTRTQLLQASKAQEEFQQAREKVQELEISLEQANSRHLVEKAGLEERAREWESRYDEQMLVLDGLDRDKLELNDELIVCRGRAEELYDKYAQACSERDEKAAALLQLQQAAEKTAATAREHESALVECRTKLSECVAGQAESERAWKQERGDLLAKWEQQVDKCVALSVEGGQLRARLEAAQQEHAHMKTRLEQELHVMRTEKENNARDLATLRQQVHDLTLQHAIAVGKAQETSSHKLSEQQQLLRDKERDYNTLMVEFREKQAQWATKMDEKLTAITSLEKSLVQLQDKHAVEIEKLGRERDDALARVQKEKEEAEREHARKLADVQALHTREVGELQLVLQHKSSECDTLLHARNTLEQDLRVSREEARQMSDKYMSLLTTHNQHLIELTQVTERYEVAREQLSELGVEIDEYKKHDEEGKGRYSLLLRQYEDLTNTLTDTQAQLSTLQTKYNGDIQSAQQHMDKAHERNQLLESQLMQANNDITTLRTNVNNLEKQAQEQQQSLSNLNDLAAARQATIDELRGSLLDHEAHVAALETRLNTTNTELDAARARVRECEALLEQRQREYSEMVDIYEARLRAQADEHEANYTQCMTQWQAKYDGALHEWEEKYETSTVEWRDRCDALVRDYEQRLEQVIAEKDAEYLNMVSEYKHLLAEKEKEIKDNEEFFSKTLALRDQEHQEMLARLAGDHQAQLDKLAHQHEVEMHDKEQEWAQKLETEKERATNAERELVICIEDHAREVEKLRAAHQEEVRALEAAFKEDSEKRERTHEQEMQQLRFEHREKIHELEEYYSNKLHAVELEMTKLDHAHAHLRTLYEELSEKHGGLVNDHNKLKVEHEELRARLQQVQKLKEDIERDLNDTKASLATTLAKAERDQQQHQLALSTVNSDLEALRKSVQKLQLKVEERDLQIQSLNMRLRQAEMLSGDDVSNMARNRANEAETRALNLEFQLRHREAELQDSSRARRELEARLRECQDKVSALQFLPHEVQRLKHVESNLQVMEVRVRQLEDENSRLCSEGRVYKNENVRLAGLVDESERVVKMLREDIVTLERTVKSEREAALSKLQQYKQEQVLIQQEQSNQQHSLIQKLENQLSEQKSLVLEREHEITALKNSVDSVMSKLNSVDVRSKEELQHKVLLLEEHKKKKEEEMALLQHKLSLSAADNNKLGIQVRELSAQVEAMQDVATHPLLRQKIAAVLSECNEWKLKCAQAQKQTVTLAHRIESYNHDNTEAANVITQLKMSLLECSKRLELCMREEQQCRELLDAAREECAKLRKLQGDVEVLKVENSQLNALNEVTRTVVQEKEASIKELRAELEERDAAVRKTRKERDLAMVNKDRYVAIMKSLDEQYKTQMGKVQAELSASVNNQNKYYSRLVVLTEQYNSLQQHYKQTSERLQSCQDELVRNAEEHVKKLSAVEGEWKDKYEKDMHDQKTCYEKCVEENQALYKQCCDQVVQLERRLFVTMHEYSEKIEEMGKEHQAILEKANVAHEDAMGELKRVHHEATESLIRKYAEEKKKSEDTLQSHLNGMKKEYNAVIVKMDQESKQQREQFQRDLDAQRSALTAEHKHALAELQQRLDAEKQALETRTQASLESLRAAHSQALAQAQKEHERRRESMAVAHEAQMQDIVCEYSEKVAALEGELRNTQQHLDQTQQQLQDREKQFSEFSREMNSRVTLLQDELSTTSHQLADSEAGRTHAEQSLATLQAAAVTEQRTTEDNIQAYNDTLYAALSHSKAQGGCKCGLCPPPATSPAASASMSTAVSPSGERAGSSPTLARVSVTSAFAHILALLQKATEKASKRAPSSSSSSPRVPSPASPSSTSSSATPASRDDALLPRPLPLTTVGMGCVAPIDAQMTSLHSLRADLRAAYVNTDAAISDESRYLAAAAQTLVNIDPEGSAFAAVLPSRVTLGSVSNSVFTALDSVWASVYYLRARFLERDSNSQTAVELARIGAMGERLSEVLRGMWGKTSQSRELMLSSMAKGKACVEMLYKFSHLLLFVYQHAHTVHTQWHRVFSQVLLAKSVNNALCRKLMLSMPIPVLPTLPTTLSPPTAPTQPAQAQAQPTTIFTAESSGAVYPENSMGLDNFGLNLSGSSAPTTNVASHASDYASSFPPSGSSEATSDALIHTHPPAHASSTFMSTTTTSGDWRVAQLAMDNQNLLQQRDELLKQLQRSSTGG